MKTLVIIAAALLSISLRPAAQEPRLPDGFSESVYASGLSAPTSMAFAPDGRLFVTEQGGAVRVISANGSLLGASFTSFTVDSANERGLLGLAFDPNFASNNYVYFYYTTPDGPRNRVDRVTANGNQAVPGSGDRLFQLPVLNASNHNGGALHFGKDGKLYVAVGENAVPSLSQSMSTRLGKMLRYNSDGSIPSDNPFYNSASGANRAIWALGLRNPYTFAVHPVSGTIFINDVGGGDFEEVNRGEAGANYGWPATEGYTNNPAYHSPLYAYANDASTCAIAGGTFYAPSTAMFPDAYMNAYFFADLCARDIYVRFSSGDVETFESHTAGSSIVDLDVGPDGALYYLSRGSGAVHRIAYALPPIEGELVKNGSFEKDGNSDGIPNRWTPSASARVKRVCGGQPFITAGSCALRIKNTTGSSVKQIIKGKRIASGSALALSAMVAGKNVPAGAFIRLNVITTGGKSTYLLPVPSGTFSTQQISHPTITTAGQGKKLNVAIKLPAGGGKLFVDELSILADAP